MTTVGSVQRKQGWASPLRAAQRSVPGRAREPTARDVGPHDGRLIAEAAPGVACASRQSDRALIRRSDLQRQMKGYQRPVIITAPVPRERPSSSVTSPKPLRRERGVRSTYLSGAARPAYSRVFLRSARARGTCTGSAASWARPRRGRRNLGCQPVGAGVCVSTKEEQHLHYLMQIFIVMAECVK